MWVWIMWTEEQKKSWHRYYFCPSATLWPPLTSADRTGPATAFVSFWSRTWGCASTKAQMQSASIVSAIRSLLLSLKIRVCVKIKVFLSPLHLALLTWASAVWERRSGKSLNWAELGSSLIQRCTTVTHDLNHSVVYRPCIMHYAGLLAFNTQNVT